MTAKEFEIQNALGTLSYEMRQELACDKRTPKKILTKLSTDKDWWVRYWIANNSNTPIEILKKLSKDKDKPIIRHRARGQIQLKGSL